MKSFQPLVRKHKKTCLKCNEEVVDFTKKILCKSCAAICCLKCLDDPRKRNAPWSCRDCITNLSVSWGVSLCPECGFSTVGEDVSGVLCGGVCGGTYHTQCLNSGRCFSCLTFPGRVKLAITDAEGTVNVIGIF